MSAIPARTSLATAASPATRPVSWGHQASDTEHGVRSRIGTKVTPGRLYQWFLPVAVAAFLYTAAVIVIALAPHEGHTAAMYLAGAEVVGLVWYLLYLRTRITRQSVGVYRRETVDAEEPAEARLG